MTKATIERRFTQDGFRPLTEGYQPGSNVPLQKGYTPSSSPVAQPATPKPPSGGSSAAKPASKQA